MRMPATILAALVLGLGIANAAPLDLKRGVNIHEWLNWAPLAADGSYRWPPYRTVEEWLASERPVSDWATTNQFSRIREMGFDFVRLSTDPGPLLASEGIRRQEALHVLEDAVRQVAAAGLSVVIDLHGVTQVPAYSMDVVNAPAESAGIAHYREMVADVARMLAATNLPVALEPFNEPAHYPCDSDGDGDWQQIMSMQVAAIRAVAPNLPIVATGACGGSITGLVDLDPVFDDPAIYYSFHMYEPHSFTHQRLDDPTQFASGLPWPAAAGTAEIVLEGLRARMDAAGLSALAQVVNIGAVQGVVDDYFRTNWGESQLHQRFAEAASWAAAHDIPTTRLFMGEFGVIAITPDGRMGAFAADRLRYLRAVRTAAEAYGIPWAVWEYANPHGMSLILPTGPAIPDDAMLEALGMPP